MKIRIEDTVYEGIKTSIYDKCKTGGGNGDGETRPALELDVPLNGPVRRREVCY